MVFQLTWSYNITRKGQDVEYYLLKLQLGAQEVMLFLELLTFIQSSTTKDGKKLLMLYIRKEANCSYSYSIVGDQLTKRLMEDSKSGHRHQ